MRFKAEIDAVDKTGMTEAVIEALKDNGCEASAMGHPEHNATSVTAEPRIDSKGRAFRVLMSFQGQTLKAALLAGGESAQMDHGATEWRARDGEISPEVKSRLYEVNLDDAASRQTYLDAVSAFAANLTADDTLDKDAEEEDSFTP